MSNQAPMNPQETAQAVLDQIRMHPETHDQSSWEGSDLCGTTHCVAGWAVALHGMTMGEVYDSGSGMQDTGRRLLGLSVNDAMALFNGTSNSEAVHALEYLAKGDRIDWEDVIDDE